MKWVVVVLLAAALVAAAPEPDGFRMDDYRAPVPATLQGGTVVHIAEMREIVEHGGAVLVDVLPAPRRPEAMRPGMPWLPQPHRSLPGSLWWPEAGRGALPPAMEAEFHRRLHDFAGDKTVVFFCLSDCWMSWNAAKRAVRWGYRAAWFPEGADLWEAAGLMLQTVTPEPLD